MRSINLTKDQQTTLHNILKTLFAINFEEVIVSNSHVTFHVFKKRRLVYNWILKIFKVKRVQSISIAELLYEEIPVKLTKFQTQKSVIDRENKGYVITHRNDIISEKDENGIDGALSLIKDALNKYTENVTLLKPTLKTILITHLAQSETEGYKKRVDAGNR